MENDLKKGEIGGVQVGTKSPTKSKLLNTSLVNNVGARVQPHVIVGPYRGFTSGDILDANAVAMMTEGGGGGAISNDAVLYTEQILTEAQKNQARANIGAAKTGDGVQNMAQSASAYTTLIKPGNDESKQSEIRITENQAEMKVPAANVTISSTGVNLETNTRDYPNAKVTVNGVEIATKTELSSIQSNIEDNELVISSALNDLNSRIIALTNRIAALENQ